MKVVFDDGGRKEAGFKGLTGDCVTRSIAIATGKPYREVYDTMNRLTAKDRVKGKNSSARSGVPRKVYDKYLKSLGWKWVPCMKIGSGCKVHLHDGELPNGTLICRLSKHLTVVIDGVIHDTFDPQRSTIIFDSNGQHISHRCVYGYYTIEGHNETR